MRNILRSKKGISIWLLVLVIVLANILLILTAEAAEPKAKSSKQKICGDNLELVWEKQIVPKVDKGTEIDMQVHPSGDNYMVHISLSKIDAPDVNLGTARYLIDANGNKLWEKWDSFDDLTFVFFKGYVSRNIFPIGKQTYLWYETTAYSKKYKKGMRYHVWLDEEGFIQWVHAHRFNSSLYQRSDFFEVVDGVVNNFAVNCKDDKICQVDRLAITEKGVDSKGWQTILHWPYPKDSEKGTLYYPLDVSNSHLLIYKEAPKGSKGDKTEFRIVRFSPNGNGQIILESKYLFSWRGETAFTKNQDGGFTVFTMENNEGILIRLDNTGKQIESKSYILPQRFTTWISAIKLYKEGYLVEGNVDKKYGPFGEFQSLLRLKSDGQPVWFHVFKWDTKVLVGIDGENIFFSRRGNLYKCREK